MEIRFSIEEMMAINKEQRSHQIESMIKSMIYIYRDMDKEKALKELHNMMITYHLPMTLYLGIMRCIEEPDRDFEIIIK